MYLIIVQSCSDLRGLELLAFSCFLLACVASVSNQVIARKLERKQKKRLKGEGEGRRGSPPPPPSFIFFCSRSNFLDEPREETLATQASFLLRAVEFIYYMPRVSAIKKI